MKKWEAETKAIQEQKIREQAQAEFQAEQEKMETYSLCSEAEQKRYRDRQSISFMYAKPPGLEAALAKQAAAETEKAKAAQEASAVANTQPGGVEPGAGGKQQLSRAQHDEIANRTKELDRVREDPFAMLLKARAALQNHERFAIKQSGGGTFGGFSSQAQNQQLLEDEDIGPPQTLTAAGPSGRGLAPPGIQGGGVELPDPATLASMSDAERSAIIKRLKKIQKQQEQERKLQEAEAILRSAGFDLSALPPVEELPSDTKKSSKKKRKKHSKDKSGKSSKRARHGKKHKRSRDSDSDSSSDS
ncbi:hypothetical protein DUNSADRAFT_13812 [Dunaliella salina]|uniref:CBF1-interacting co-repressor CIR N-terminal domain-containing protein n=1 Tax=Dunaliella salina TaxID=3046 RepID=A0ABQ7G8M0_DUNSA|nr:hypothetical protein DUNSADRAFT_13812 [Dunaliella salina]|eukprot:KAF5830955.1 hypothetical protein DUNSADRAFT_13812 [Dunaliella salina]